MRFRFTIRDLLWLTVVIAIAVAWFLDRHKLWFWNFQELQWIIGFACGCGVGYAFANRGKRADKQRFFE